MITTEQPCKSSRILAEGNGLHVELDDQGHISLVLWGISWDDDTTIFDAKLTPKQEHLIRNANKVDAWTVDESVKEQLACL